MKLTPYIDPVTGDRSWIHLNNAVRLRNKHRGATMLCLGGGPSIAQHPPEDLRAFPTIGCNQIANHVVTDYCTLVDPPYKLKQQKDLKGPHTSLHRSTCFVLNTWWRHPGAKPQEDAGWGPHIARTFPMNPPPDPVVFAYHTKMGGVWQDFDAEVYRQMLVAPWDDPKAPFVLPYAPSSLGLCVFLALYMGATTIGVLGLDWTPGHFWSEQAPFMRQRLDNLRPRAEKDWAGVRHIAAEVFEAEVFNLSNVSTITALERAELADLHDHARPGS